MIRGLSTDAHTPTPWPTHQLLEALFEAALDESDAFFSTVTYCR